METQAFGLLLAQLGQGDARQQVGRVLDQTAKPQLCCPRCGAA